MDIRTLASAGYDLWDEPCTESGTTISGASTIEYIWNGIGALDIGGDWLHSQYGTETSESMHTGSNGLDASGMTKTDKIWFTNIGEAVDANLYDTLVMWVNVKTWPAGKDITVELHTIGDNNVYVYLSRYLTVDAIDVWQKVIIPLTHFGNTGDFKVDRLRLWPDGNIGLWLDDIYFSMGAIVGMPVCDPEMTADVFGVMDVRATTLVPSGRTQGSSVPSGQVTVGLVPSGRAKKENFVPSGKPVFPAPSNL